MENWYRLVNTYRKFDPYVIERVEVDYSTQEFIVKKRYDGSIERTKKITDYHRYFPDAVDAIHDALNSVDRAQTKAKRELEWATAKAAVLRKLLEEQK